MISCCCQERNDHDDDRTRAEPPPAAADDRTAGKFRMMVTIIFHRDTLWMWPMRDVVWLFELLLLLCYYRYYCSSDFLRCWLVFAEEWWWWCTEKDKFWIYLQWYSPSDTLNLMEKHIAIIFEFYKKDVLLFVKWMAPQHEWISYIRDGVHPPSIQLLISFPPIIFLFY